jgi:hypothetical protein
LSSRTFESFKCLRFVSETAKFRKPIVITLKLVEKTECLVD